MLYYFRVLIGWVSRVCMTNGLLPHWSSNRFWNQVPEIVSEIKSLINVHRDSYVL